MGNNQSENNRPTQPQINLSDVQRMLNTQRQMYEQKLQDELAKQRAQQLREQEAKERRAKEQEAREKLAKEQEAREKLAKEQEARKKLAKEQEARKKLAKEQEAREKLAKEQEAREKLAKEQEAREKLAKEQEAREKLAKEQEAREKLAKEQEAREKLAKEQEAREKLAKEQEAREKLAKEQEAREKLAKEQEAREKLAKEQEAREKLAKEQAKQRAEQSSNSSNTVPSNSVGGPQQQAAVIVLPQQLYPTLTQTPNYSIQVNQPHPLIQTNPFQQPNPMFQHYPQLNPPQPWNPPQHVNHPRNQPNSDQNRATPTLPPQDFVFVNVPGQRARPVNKNRGIYDCPTCNQRYGLKIFQCPNGHSACNDCKIRGRACAICGLSLTGVRNFEVENYVAHTPTTCPNKNEGCNSMIKQFNMDKHLECCPFKGQSCPLAVIFGTCRWKGKLSQLSTHFDEMHSSNRGVDVDKEIYLRDIHNSSRQVHLVVIGGYNFLCHLQVSETDGKIFMAVQLLGNTAAKKWTYEIHVYKKSEPRRKYMYSNTCVSSKEEVFKSGKCAVLPIFYAATFVDREGMAFKFSIQKISNKNNEDNNQDDQPEENLSVHNDNNINEIRENMNGNDTGKNYYNYRGRGRGRGRGRAQSARNTTQRPNKHN